MLPSRPVPISPTRIRAPVSVGTGEMRTSCVGSFFMVVLIVRLLLWLSRWTFDLHGYSAIHQSHRDRVDDTTADEGGTVASSTSHVSYRPCIPALRRVPCPDRSD